MATADPSEPAASESEAGLAKSAPAADVGREPAAPVAAPSPAVDTQTAEADGASGKDAIEASSVQDGQVAVPAKAGAPQAQSGTEAAVEQKGDAQDVTGAYGWPLTLEADAEPKGGRSKSAQPRNGWRDVLRLPGTHAPNIMSPLRSTYAPNSAAEVDAAVAAGECALRSTAANGAYDASMRPEALAEHLERVSALLEEGQMSAPTAIARGVFTTLDAAWLQLEEEACRSAARGEAAMRQLADLSVMSKQERALERLIAASKMYKGALTNALYDLKRRSDFDAQRCTGGGEEGAIAALRETNFRLKSDVRRLNSDNARNKRYKDDQDIRAAHFNKEWRNRKVTKYTKQTELWSALDKKAKLERRVWAERKLWVDRALRGTQEITKLNTQLQTARVKLETLQDRIEHEEMLASNVLTTRKNETEAFGIFADNEEIMRDLGTLGVSIEPIHELNAESRRFALLHLSDRFDQLRRVGQHMRRIVDAATKFHHTLDLSDTLDCINAVTADLMDATSARVLLLDQHETYFWCPYASGSGDEDEETQLRFNCKVGITGQALRERRLVKFDDPPLHPEYSEDVDGILGIPPHSFICCPIFDPSDPDTPIGILQCLNKKSMDTEFDAIDEFTLRQLVSQAASAVQNAVLYDLEYRKELYVRRVLDLCHALPLERDLNDLARVFMARAKELTGADRARLFFRDTKTGDLTPHPAVDGRKFLATVKRFANAEVHPLAATELEEAVARSGELVNIVDGEVDPRYDRSHDEATNFVVKRALSVPFVASNGAVLGVLTLLKGWPTDDPPANIWSSLRLAPFMREDESALQQFARLCTVTLQNAVLFERLQRQPAIVTKITTSLTVQQALELSAETLTQVIDAEAIRFVFPLPESKRAWAWSKAAGLHRPPMGGVIGACMRHGLPVRLSVEPLREGSRPSSASLRPTDSHSSLSHCDIGTAYSAASDDCPGVATSHMLLVPIIDPKATTRAAPSASAAATAASVTHEGHVMAVLQVVNRKDGFAFDCCDEYLVSAFSQRVAYALVMARANDATAKHTKHTDILARAACDIHDFVAEEAGAERDNGAFAEWIQRQAGEAAPSDSIAVHWADRSGYLPSIKKHSTDLLNARTGMGHRSNRKSMAWKLEMHVPIKDSDGVLHGILHCNRDTLGQDIFGPAGYDESEVAAVAELASHVGLFLEACKPVKGMLAVA